MTNTQMITVIATILASQFGTLYYLSARIDLLGTKIDALIKTVHEIDVRVVKLEERKAS